MGPAIQLLRSLVDCLIEHEIEIAPRYVRCGSNFSRDQLSRTDAHGIGERAKTTATKQVQLPNSWFGLPNAWKPDLEFANVDRFNSPRFLRRNSEGLAGCEWRPSEYGFVEILESTGRIFFVHEPTHLRVQTPLKTSPGRYQQSVDLLCGMVLADFELSDSFYSVGQICPKYDIAIAAYAFRGPTDIICPWAKCVIADFPNFSSVVNQRWRIYIWGKIQLGMGKLPKSIWDLDLPIAVCLSWSTHAVKGG